MNFRIGVGYVTLNILVLFAAIISAVMEFVLAVILFIPALIRDHYPKWARFCLTRYFLGG